MPDSPIGLVGVGLLGTALAERMLAAGIPILGHDLAPAPLDRLAQLGGTPLGDIHQIPARCDGIVLCLPDSHVVASVVDAWGDKLTPGTLLIDATTGEPEVTEALGESLNRRGISYIDATIAGSSEQVRSGEAVVIVGGQAEQVERAENVLASWSPRRFHVGPVGSGARFKLVVNLVLGLNRAVLAEGLALAKACGINSSLALNVLRATPAYSAAMDIKGPKMTARDYTPQARLAQHHKDVRLIRKLARKHQARTPLSDLHEELLQQAIELGYGEADNSAIIESFLQGHNPNL
jgi:3-hydroxyisobutyrate dehydrogenase-like beta-hydroxyacid dehydrogenase